MKIPQNLNEQEVIDTILHVARKLAPKFVFASYSEEDIVQEAFIIGIDGLEKYDSSRPLSNFMFTHISNRLKNFKRDNYYRLDVGSGLEIQTKKRAIMDAMDIESVQAIYHTERDEVESREIIELIDRKLPSEFRRDYLKLQANAPLTKTRKAQILQIIEDIIDQGEEYTHTLDMHNNLPED